MITIRNLTVRYGTGLGLRDVSVGVTAGEIIAVVGPNGSGKSTLLKAIAGLLSHDGHVGVTGRIAYMPQDNGARAALSVLEAVLLGRMRGLGLGVSRHELEAAAALLSPFGLDALSGRSLAELSGGQRQLVFLAQALASDPHVLLLDEPTSALDIRNALELCQTVKTDARRARRTVLASMHDLNAAARFADRMLVLSNGRLVADGPAHAVLTPDLIRAVYGVETDRMDDKDGRPVLSFTATSRAANEMTAVSPR